MPKKISNQRYPGLTYQPRPNQRDRWRKRYRGKEYYFVRRDGENVEASYRRCLAEWKRLKAEVDRENDPDEIAKAARDHWQGLASEAKAGLERIERLAHPTATDREEYERLLMKKLWAEKHARSGFPLSPSVNEMAAEFRNDVPQFFPWNAKELAETDPVDDGETLRANVDAFLDRKLTQHKQGKLSAKRYGALKTSLDEAVDVLGETSPVANLDGVWMERVRDTFERRVADGKLAPSSARDGLQAWKQFVKWLYERGTIERPRNLDSKEMNIAASTPNPEKFEDDELKTLFAAKPSDRLRLFMLLMLNCGMTQQDVADLTKEEFDAKTGTITRQRSKTRKKHSDKVPTVTWRLWPETLRLLNEFRDKKKAEPLLLLNESGGPLKVNRVVDDKVVTVDNVNVAFGRLRAKMKKAGTDVGKPLKVFRSTASSKLESNATYSRYTQHFLAQSGRTIADRHYVVVDQGEFDAAVEWLGRQWPKLSGCGV